MFRANIDPNFDINASSQQPQQQEHRQDAARDQTSAAPSSPTSNNGQRATTFYVWLGLQCASVLFYIMLFFSSAASFATYSWYLFACQLVVYGMAAHNRHGMIQLNAQYAMRAFQDANVHYLMYCLVFLMNPGGLVPPLPVVVPALFHALRALNPIVNHSLFQSISARIFIWEPKAQQFLVQLEVLLVPLLLFQLLTGSGSIFSVFGCYQFVKFRYMMSQATREVVHLYVGKMDAAANAYMPQSLLVWYNKARQWMAQVPQPHPAHSQ